MENKLVLAELDQVKDMITSSINIALKDFAPLALPEFYTVKELAERLKCSSRSIYNYKEQGLLKFTPFPGLVRFSHSQVLEFMKTGGESRASIVECPKHVS